MVNKGSPYSVEMEMAVSEAESRRRLPKNQRPEVTMSAGLPEEIMGKTDTEGNQIGLE